MARNNGPEPASAGGIPVYCAHDEVRPIESITPNPRNPNTHPEKQIELLARIIRDQGWRAPITVSTRSGFVVRGHGRLAAAIAAGATHVPVDLQDYPDEASEWADLVADNRIAELAQIDTALLKDLLEDIDTGAIDIELTGFTVDEVEAMMTATFDGITVTQDEPPAIAEDEEPTAKRGQVWRLGDHRLMCGDGTDAADVARLMNGQTAAALLTDPPYNVDYTGKTANALKIKSDQQEGAAFAAFLRALLGIAADNAAPGAPAYIFHADMKRAEFQAAMIAAGWGFRATLQWIKDRFVLGRSDYHWQHEPILYGWKEGAAHPWYGNRDKTTVVDDDAFDFASLKKADLVAILEAIREDSAAIREERPSASTDHPTMKPTKLLARLISNSTQRGDLIYDPCGGSGSTLIAADQLARRCYTMEIDPRYADVIIRRWENQAAAVAVLEE
jgi:DNA modification methylase